MMSAQHQNMHDLLRPVDDLLRKVRAWVQENTGWEPLREARSQLLRELPRVEKLRTKVDAPLVVATFGGTGTGKSTLVNALAGEVVTTSGRERPTTTRPILIAHESNPLERLEFSPAQFEVVKVRNPFFQDLILIDCPDPDTNETETEGSNLEKLHHLLPFCDCLIYTATQQKYRSSRVVQELARASEGCRLVFVQTNADLDVDIREDWRKQLAGHYSVADLFFVNSVGALQAQQTGGTLDPEFVRLRELLTEELSTARRIPVRRANLLNLLQTLLEQARGAIQPTQAKLTALEQALEQQRTKTMDTLSRQLQRELHAGQRLWERQLLALVTEYWGMSPFSAVLQLYNGLGALLASAALMRARSTTQVALVGALQGLRWIQSRQEEQSAQDRLLRLGSVGLDDASLRETQVLIAGYLQEARFDAQLLHADSLDHLRNEAAQFQDQFLQDTGERLQEMLNKIAQGEVRTPIRLICEVSFSLFLAFLLWRIGKNFFWDSFFYNAEILHLNFYIPALIFTALLSALLVFFFTRHLGKILNEGLTSLSYQFATNRFTGGLFPEVDQSCRETRRQLEQLDKLWSSNDQLRRSESHGSLLGSPVHG
ncbi:MAG: GTPase domain-containing protein [Planctomycetales bacterium]